MVEFYRLDLDVSRNMRENLTATLAILHKLILAHSAVYPQDCLEHHNVEIKQLNQEPARLPVMARNLL